MIHSISIAFSNPCVCFCFIMEPLQSNTVAPWFHQVSIDGIRTEDTIPMKLQYCNLKKKKKKEKNKITQKNEQSISYIHVFCGNKGWEDISIKETFIFTFISVAQEIWKGD